MNSSLNWKAPAAAQLIEEMSQGRLQVCPSVVGQVYIRPQHDSNLGMDMRIDSIPGQPHYRSPLPCSSAGWGRIWLRTIFGHCCPRLARPMR